MHEQILPEDLGALFYGVNPFEQLAKYACNKDEDPSRVSKYVRLEIPNNKRAGEIRLDDETLHYLANLRARNGTPYFNSLEHEQLW